VKAQKLSKPIFDVFQFNVVWLIAKRLVEAASQPQVLAMVWNA